MNKQDKDELLNQGLTQKQIENSSDYQITAVLYSQCHLVKNDQTV